MHLYPSPSGSSSARYVVAATLVFWACVSPVTGGWFDSYQSYASYNQQLNSYASTYPSLASTLTIGQSYENRAIPGLRITGTGPANVAKKAVVFHSMVHAREWIAGTVPMFIADQLLQNYGTDPRVTNVLNNTEIYILPVMNPDGYEYSRNTFRYWRKNRRPTGGGNVGVDLNRNFGVGYGLNSGSSSNPSSETYRGPSAFSEPESQALRDFFINHPNTVANIDFHSYSQLILLPWTHKTDPAPDQSTLVQMSQAMATAIQGVHGEFYDWNDPFLYLASGTIIDWVYGDQGAYSYTIELRPTTSNPGFELPASEIIPTGQEMFPAALRFAEFVVQMAGGDFNIDGVMNCTDIDALVASVVNGTTKAERDLTGDGLYTLADVNNWLSRAGSVVLGPGRSFLPGDANLDGFVDGTDFNVWNANKFTSRASWCSGDFNADGAIDGTDFGLWNTNKFTSSDAFLVPEPMWQSLLGIGTLLMGWRARRDRFR